ncbi:sugar transferase [Holdemanella biformis]|uniref:Sugar transferase n=1 Tax=Holdemanella biformis TaxID=1735 RepID=A0A413UD83_9FIRM|nr:sugar transferase [Holdemanella biformis]RHB07212.1 sugar transferase [Holdemanella biformis]
MYRRFIKRIIDFIFSLCALPFVLIEIILLGPIIFLTDKGPIFYNAERLGKDGKTYKMFKLRSMKVNAPDIRNEDGSTFNGDNDPRVTKIGRLMRKTSLDEFPQFLNVLFGHMSLIGPRPTVPMKGFDVNKLDNVEKKHYTVKPGITGYSQAYYRNSISQDEKFKNDAYYADHVSFGLDVKILLKTIQSVIHRENIYNQ